jgi:hypothetical protein
MTSDEWATIKFFLTLVSSSVTVIGGVLTFLSLRLDPDGLLKTRTSFENLARRINSTPFIRLPSVLRGLSSVYYESLEYVSRLVLNSRLIGYAFGIFAAISLWYKGAFKNQLFPSFLSVPYAKYAIMALVMFNLAFTWVSSPKFDSKVFLISRAIIWMILTPIGLFWIMCAGVTIIDNISSTFSLDNIIWLLAGFSLCLVIADAITIFADSVSYLFRGHYFTSAQTDVRNFSIAAGIGISISVTIFAVYIGNYFYVTPYSIISPQLVLSNILFDSISVFIFVYLLRRYDSNWIIVPIILLSALFSILSVWFGLVGSKYALTIPEIGRILVARSPDGANFSVGGLFWLLHTTFMPILAFSLMLCILGIAKAILLLTARMIQDASKSHYGSPWQIIAGSFTCMVVILSAFVNVADVMKDRAERREHTKPSTVTTPYPANGAVVESPHN